MNTKVFFGIKDPLNPYNAIRVLGKFNRRMHLREKHSQFFRPNRIVGKGQTEEKGLNRRQVILERLFAGRTTILLCFPSHAGWHTHNYRNLLK